MAAPWPPDPEEFPPGDFPPPAQLPGMGRFMRKRYTNNVVVSDQMDVNDLLHDVMFVGSRMYFAQAPNGQISVRNKKPAPWALGRSVFTAGDMVLNVDDVSDWISKVDNWLLVAPHTTDSEIKRVVASAYSSSQNAVSLTQTAFLPDGTTATTNIFTITGFSGCDGANTPATANVAVGSFVAGNIYSLTLDGVRIAFTPSSSDTAESIASFLAGTIGSHPALMRRFRAAWSSGDTDLDIVGKFGTLTLDAGLRFTTSVPIANPTVAPVLSGSSGGSFAAGVYYLVYAYVNASGETLVSPYGTATLTANQKIDVTAITLPSGASSVKWFVSPKADSNKLRYIAENDGSAFSITTLPLLTAPLPPDLNRTGTEVMRVEAVFSDREEPRSATSRANVIRASYSWLLGNKQDSVNRIDLLFRDANEDWRLKELRVRDDAHIAKIKKVANKELNGQAIDNTDQAYRIAVSQLAEYRDANFFYKWSATRGHLLLQEGDVVAITDDGSGVYNLPVIIEGFDLDPSGGGLPKGNFTGRKYSSSLYDDSIVDRTIPVVTEPNELSP